MAKWNNGNRRSLIVFLHGEYTGQQTFPPKLYAGQCAALSMYSKLNIFTARRYASAVYAVVVCPSVRLSVCQSQAGIVSKPLNTESRKHRHTIVQGV